MSSNDFKEIKNHIKRSKSNIGYRGEETGNNYQLSIATLNHFNKLIYKENKENFNAIRIKNKDSDKIFKTNIKEINQTEENIYPTKYYNVFRSSKKNKRISCSRVKSSHNDLENINKNLKKENENLKKKINDYKKKLNEANEKLQEKEKIIAKNKKEIEELKKIIEEKENSLNKCLEEKNKLINDIEKLKTSIPNKSSEEKLISIVFLSSDENICYPVICKNTDIFIKIENLIYEKYPEYKDTKKEFFINGNKFNKNGSLEENNIKDKSVISLQINKIS